MMGWLQDNWAYVTLGLFLVRDFLNCLLHNCPFLKANRTFELIQGIFDAAVQTLIRRSDEKDTGTGSVD